MHFLSAIIWLIILGVVSVLTSIDWTVIGKIIQVILIIGGGLLLFILLFALFARPVDNSKHSEQTELRPGYSQGTFYKSAVGTRKHRLDYERPALAEAAIFEKGIIIDEPWIGKILSGEKTWEMRSTGARHRGPIALIKKGSKTVFGVAELYDCSDRLSLDELKGSQDQHCIPDSILEAPDYKWNVAWKLKNIHRLDQPVPYQHKGGSTIWVSLDEQAKLEVSEQADLLLGSPPRIYDIFD